MATNRDVELGITVTTAGSEDIKKLKDEVQALAKQGGAAAPEFNKLADELDRLGQQAKTLETFDQIGRDVTALALAQNSAQQATAEMSAELAKATRTADEFRAKQAQAKTELQTAQKSLTDARIALAEYKISQEAAAASADVYRAKVRELSSAVIEARKSLSDKAIALRQTKDETRAAEAEEAKLERAYKRSEAASREATAALGAKEQAQREALTSLSQLGVETENLRAVDISLLNAVTALETQTQELVTSQLRAAEAAKAQAREEERLAAIVMNTKREMAAAAQQQLATERAAWAEMEAAQKRAATEAQQAAQAIKNALGTVGVKSAESLRAEIQQVRDSLKLLGDTGTLTGRELAAAMQTGEARINALQRELREATGSMTVMDRASNLLRTSIVGQLAAFVSLTEVVQRTGREFFSAARQIEQMRGALGQIYGSSQLASQQIDFLRKTASTAGVSLAGLGDSFTRFSASAQAANIPLATANDLFAAVTRAGGILGLTADKTSHAIDALGQIASKGTVSMEELRQQMGDALPGSFAIAAKGLGVTTAELVKLVESGQLTVDRFFPAFRKGLEDTFGTAETKVQGFFRAWERLQTAIRTLFQDAADSSAFKALGTALDFLADNLRTVTSAVYGFGTALVTLKLLDYVRGLGQMSAASRTVATDIATKTAAVTADTAATAANTAALSANTAAKAANAAATTSQSVAASASAAAANLFVGGLTAGSRAVTALGGAIRGLWSLLGGLPGLFIAVALNARELGTYIGESIASWTRWGKTLEENEKKLLGIAEAEKKAARAREDAQIAATTAFQKEVEALNRATAAAEGKVQAAVKGTAADKVRADNIEKIASLYGTEAERARAAAEATEVVLVAAERETAVRRTALEAATAELAAKDKLIAASPLVSEKVKEETEKLRVKVEKMKEESAESENTVRSLQIESAERRIASEAIKDNSDKVEEYKEAMLAARKNLADVIEMQKAGLPVGQALAKAEMDLAVATRRYSDAVNDKVAKQRVATDLMKAETDATLAQLGARKAELESMKSLAQAVGDDALARHATIELRQVEIDIINAQVAAAIKEQEGIIATTKLKLEEVRVREPANKLAQQELETIIKIAEAQIVVQNARQRSTEVMERELIALRNGTAAKNENRNASNEASSAISRETEVRFKSAEAIQLENDRLAAQNNLRKVGSQYYDQQGFAANANGSRISAEMPSWMSVYNYTKGLGVSDEEARNIADQAYGPGGEYSPRLQNNNMRSEWDSIDVYEAARREAEKIIRSTPSAPVASGTSGASAAPAASGGVRTIRVQMGGGSTDINVASAQDGAKLESLIQQLAAAKGSTL